MAMLAEQKSRQKWSDDPRNTKWSRNKDRYGYQMLEKMGWDNGKGLGKNKSGTTSHVKIKKRQQNLGLGARESNDHDWIAQQTDFNNLLSALQQHCGNAELRSEEQNQKAMLDVAKASRKRVFYKRFIRSKDTSQYSQKDMACILGSTQDTTPAIDSSDATHDRDIHLEHSTTTGDSGIVTYTSKQNIHEYFAQRMKDLNCIKGGSLKEGELRISTEEVSAKRKKKRSLDEVADDETRKSKKQKKKKQKLSEVQNDEDGTLDVHNGENLVNIEKRKKKKSKKKNVDKQIIDKDSNKKNALEKDTRIKENVSDKSVTVRNHKVKKKKKI